MPKFKIGDKVKIDGGCPWCEGLEVEIYSISDSSYYYAVKGEPHDYSNADKSRCYELCHLMDENDNMILVNKSPDESNKQGIFKRMNYAIKKLLDKSLRDLVKAGFLNDNLTLTTEGQEVLNTLLVEKFKEELAVIAQEKIRDTK